MAGSPLDQFKIVYLTDLPPIFGANINLTNQGLFMLISTALICGLMYLGTKKCILVPGRWQSMVESLYDLVANMIKDNVGSAGKKYFPFVFSIFMFVLFCNLIGIVPGAFTATSHIAATLALAFVVFICVTITGFVFHGVKYLKFLLPSGTPLWLAPIMIVIEAFSYLVRPFSLSIRLTANMIAGHVMMKIIAGFVFSLGLLLGWAPLGFLVVLTGFEIFIALIQAYIFTILTCVYLNDAVNMH